MDFDFIVIMWTIVWKMHCMSLLETEHQHLRVIPAPLFGTEVGLIIAE